MIAAVMLLQTTGFGVAAGITGTISGTISNAATGVPLAGVKINVASPTGSATATTNAQGFFSLTGLTVDTYTVSFQSPGFEPASLTGMTVFADQVLDVSTKLRKSLSTIAKVTARGSGGGAYQPKQTQDTYSVTSDQVEAILGRSDAVSESNLIASLPGATYDSSGYPVLRGGRENEEGFQNEGIDQTDAFTSQFVNSLALNPSLKSLQLTPGAGDASTGNAGTGTINLVSKRGTYPAFGSLQGTIQGPDYDHELGFEYGFASPDGRFSNYFAFEGTRLAGADFGHSVDARDLGPGGYFFNTDQISSDIVDNLVYKFGRDNSQSIQAYLENEIFEFTNTYGDTQHYYYKTNDPYFLSVATGVSGLTTAQVQNLIGLLPYQPSATAFLDGRSPSQVFEPNGTFKLQYSNNINSSTFATVKFYEVASSGIFDLPYNGDSAIGVASAYAAQGGHRTGFAADVTKQFGSVNLVQGGVKYEVLSPTFDSVDPSDGFFSTVFSGNAYDFVPASACPAAFPAGTCGYLYKYLAKPGPTPYNDEQTSTSRQDFSTYLTDTITPNSKLKIQAGLRLDGSHYRFASGESEFYAPAAVNAAGFPLNAAGQAVTSDTQTYLTNVNSSETQPLVVEPRLSSSFQLGPSDAVRASYGRSVELPALGDVDYQQGRGQFARFSNVPVNGAVCGITGNLTCQNYADQLYWINQNFLEGVPYQPVQPATFNNYDFSYSHDFHHGIGMKITPFYRRSYNDLALVASPRTGSNGQAILNPNGTLDLGPTTSTNLGVSRTSGIEFLMTKEAPVGFSGSFSATYINETSNVIPNTPDEDFFPSIPPASLALANEYRVGFLSPFQATLAVQYKSKGGLRINPQIYYSRGYPIGEGLYTATYVNGVPYNVANTNVTDPNGAAIAQQYVDPQNPGTLFKPNIDATRGVANTAAAGGVIGSPWVGANLTIEYSPPRTRSTIGVQILNLASDVYNNFGGGNTLAPNDAYQPVATGRSGPQSGYNAAYAQYPTLGGAYYLGAAEHGQSAYTISPSFEPMQIQAYYKLSI
jgi:hypothetical protein